MFNADFSLSSENRGAHQRNITITIGRDYHYNEVTLNPITKEIEPTIICEKMHIFIILKIGRYNRINDVLDGEQVCAFFSSDEDEDTTLVVSKKKIKSKQKKINKKDDGHSDIEKESSNDSVKSKTKEKLPDDIFVISDISGKSYFHSWEITRNHLEFILYSVHKTGINLSLFDDCKEEMIISKKYVKIKNYLGRFKFRIIKCFPSSSIREKDTTTILRDESRIGSIVHKDENNPIIICLKTEPPYIGLTRIVLPIKYTSKLIPVLYF